MYRLSFCLRRSVKNIIVGNSSSYSCQQIALIKELIKPLSNCRSRNSGHKVLTFQTFRVVCGMCLFRRNVFQWLTKGHTKYWKLSECNDFWSVTLQKSFDSKIVLLPYFWNVNWFLKSSIYGFCIGFCTFLLFWSLLGFIRYLLTYLINHVERQNITENV